MDRRNHTAHFELGVKKQFDFHHRDGRVSLDVTACIFDKNLDVGAVTRPDLAPVARAGHLGEVADKFAAHELFWIL